MKNRLSIVRSDDMSEKLAEINLRETAIKLLYNLPVNSLELALDYLTYLNVKCNWEASHWKNQDR